MSTSTFVPRALCRMALSMTFLKRIERSPASPETNTCCSCVSSMSIPFASAAGANR